jgi:arsenate reductase (thioredoxin)
MASALLEAAAGGTVRVLSAGSEPADQIHPPVVQVMREMGIDLAEKRPQLLADADVQAADVVVTMGCGDACPVYPGKHYLDWELPDPAGRSLDEVRRIRDEIQERVQTLLADLASARS